MVKYQLDRFYSSIVKDPRIYWPPLVYTGYVVMTRGGEGGACLSLNCTNKKQYAIETLVYFNTVDTISLLTFNTAINKINELQRSIDEVSLVHCIGYQTLNLVQRITTRFEITTIHVCLCASLYIGLRRRRHWSAILF